MYSKMDGCVKIISKDNYFISAMESLTKQISIINADDLIVFDAGQHYVYIFYASELQKYRISDPYRAMLYCCDYRIARDASINEYIKCLSTQRINKTLSLRLSPKDEWVIKIMFGEPNEDELKVLMCINRKTFSAHKVNALRKLGARNINLLHSLIQAWKEYWPCIRAELKPETKYTYSQIRRRDSVSRLSRV